MTQTRPIQLTLVAFVAQIRWVARETVVPQLSAQGITYKLALDTENHGLLYLIFRPRLVMNSDDNVGR